MWDYIYFSLELDRTDTSDQNAIQLFVYNQVWLTVNGSMRTDIALTIVSALLWCWPLYYQLSSPVVVCFEVANWFWCQVCTVSKLVLIKHVLHLNQLWETIYSAVMACDVCVNGMCCVYLVWLQIQEGSHRFFPVLKARCFKHDNDETSIRLARMEEKMQMLLNYFAIEVSSTLSNQC